MLDSIPGLVGYDLSEAEDKETQKSFSNLQNEKLDYRLLTVLFHSVI